jgi:hypothetical protein
MWIRRIIEWRTTHGEPPGGDRPDVDRCADDGRHGAEHARRHGAAGSESDAADAADRATYDPSSGDQSTDDPSSGDESTDDPSSGNESTGNESTGHTSTGHKSTGHKSTGHKSTIDEGCRCRSVTDDVHRYLLHDIDDSPGSREPVNGVFRVGRLKYVVDLVVGRARARRHCARRIHVVATAPVASASRDVVARPTRYYI